MRAWAWRTVGVGVLAVALVCVSVAVVGGAAGQTSDAPASASTAVGSDGTTAANVTVATRRDVTAAGDRAGRPGVQTTGSTARSNDTTLTVGSGKEYTTIQAAVYDADPGDTVLVYNGTYSESITVNVSGVTIRSKHGPSNTVVDVPYQERGFYVDPNADADNVRIEGLTIQAGSADTTGILAHNSGIEIVDNVITGHYFWGVRFYGVDDGLIKNNTIDGNYDGVEIYGGSSGATNNVVVANLIRNSEYGLILESDADGNEIFVNSFVGSNADHVVVSSDSDSNAFSVDQFYDYYNGTSSFDPVGNYYDDYGGNDSDDDGIGDSSYSGTSHTDDYPLVERHTNYNLAVETSYSVTPSTVEVGNAVELNATGSLDYDGTVETIEWNVNNTEDDTYEYTGLVVTHVYDEPGTYEIRVAYTDDDGLTSFRYPTVTVEDTVPPNVTVVSPDGGEVLGGGTNYTVEWNATDAGVTDAVDVSYSTDNGSTWTTVATGLTDPDASNGTYEWTVPEMNTTDALVRVTVNDTADNVGNDTSASTFTIDDDPPEVVDVAVPAAPVNESEAAAGVNVTVHFDGSMNTSDDPTVELRDLNASPLSVGGSYVDDTTWRGTVTVPDDDEEANATVLVENATDDLGTEMDRNDSTTVHVDTLAPNVTAFEATNASGTDLQVRFDATQRLTAVRVVVEDDTGTVVRTLTEGNVTESGSGPYTYTWSAAVANGTYTATLETAADEHGNDGAAGENDTATVPNSPPNGSVVAPRIVDPTATVTVNVTDVSDADGDDVTVEWDLDGDGSVEATGRNATFTAGESEYRNVTAVLTDEHGATREVASVLLVRPEPDTDDFRQFAWDTNNSGHRPGGETIRNATLLWKDDGNFYVDQVQQQVAVVDGMVFVASDHNYLAIYDADTGEDRSNSESLTGASVWRTSPAVLYNTTYVGTNDGYVAALEAHVPEYEDMGIRFESAIDGLSERGSVTVVDGYVYATDDHGTLYKFHATNGSRIWTVSTGSEVDYQSPAVVGDTVYTANSGGTVSAIDATNGTVQWSNHVVAPDAYVFSSPTYVNGTLYLGSSFGNLYAIDPANGTVLFNASIGGEIRGAPTVADGTVYVGTYDTNLYAVDAANGTILWNVSTGGKIRGSALVTGDTVFVGSYDGKLYAVDADEGAVRWTYQTNGRIEGTPAVVNGTVYVGTNNETVYALRKTEVSPTVTYHDLSVNRTTLLTDETVSVDATLQNEWEFDEPYNASLVVNGSVVAWQNGTVPGYGSTEVAFEYAFTEAGNYTVTIDGLPAETVAVDDPGEIRYSNQSVTPNPVETDETVTVETTVENVGDRDETYNASFVVDGTVVAWQNGTLAAGTSTVVEFTRNFSTAGNYSVRVDGLANETLVVKAPSNVSYDAPTVSPEHPSVREPATVNATVRNTGGFDAHYNATLTVDGTVVDHQTGTVPAESTVTVSFTYSFDAPEVYNLTVNTSDRTTTTAHDRRDYWPQFQYDSANTGHAPNTSGPVANPTVAWNYTPPGGVDLSFEDTPAGFTLVVVDDRVFVASADTSVEENYLTALDATDGAERWQHVTVNQWGVYSAAPAARNGTVLDPTSNTTSWVDEFDGSKFRWVYGEGMFEAPVTVSDRRVYTVQDTGTLDPNYVIAYDAETGDERFNVTTSDNANHVPTVHDGVVYTYSDQNEPVAYDAENGTTLWTYGSGFGYRVAPTVANGTLYTAGNPSIDEAIVHAVDTETGDGEWSFDVTFGHVYASPAVADDVVYVPVRGSGSLLALDAADGSVVWNFSTPGAVESSPTVANGVVYVGSDDGRVYAVDAETGTELWNVSVGGRVRSSPAIVNGTVYVASENAGVFAIDGEMAPLADVTANESAVLPGENVTFDAGGSVDRDGSVVEYRWDLDDDGTAEQTTTSATLSHAFETDGDKAVTVTAVDDDGHGGTATVTIHVKDVTTPEVSNFTASNPSGSTLAVSFDSNESLVNISVRVENASGTVRTLTEANFTESGSGPYTYNWSASVADGDYTATLETAEDNGGNDAADGQNDSANVDTTAPNVTDYAVSSTGDDLVVTFDASEQLADVRVNVTDGNGTHVTNLTEGDFAETATADGYAYNGTVALADGTYDATLAVAADDAGKDGADDQTDNATIDTTAPTISDFAVDDDGASLVVSLNASEPLANLSVTVEDGNGTVVRNLTEANVTESDSGPYTYEWSGELAEGTYTATLVTAADDDGNDGAVGQNDTAEVDIAVPVVRRFDAAVAGGDLVVTFDASERLADIRANVTDDSGATVATLTASDFAETATADGYAYNATLNVSDGTYTASLEHAADDHDRVADTGYFRDTYADGDLAEYVVPVGSRDDWNVESKIDGQSLRGVNDSSTFVLREPVNRSWNGSRTVSVRFVVDSDDWKKNAYLLLEDGDDQWLVRAAVQGDKLQLQYDRNANWSATTVAGSSVTIDNNAVHELNLTVDGADLTVALDDTTVLNHTHDHPVEGGTVGVGLAGGSDPHDTWFDDLTVDTAASYDDTVTVDASASEISNVSATNPDGSTLSVSFDASEQLANLSVAVENDSGTVRTLTEGDFEESGTGPYTYRWNDTVADGNYTAVVETAEDDAGNDGASDQSDWAVVDTTAPEITGFEATNPSDSTIEITFDVSEEIANVTVEVTDESGTTVATLTESDATVTGSDPYTYTLSDTVADGNYTATLTEADDGEGNDGAAGQNDTVEVDTTAPTISNFTTASDESNLAVAFDSDEALANVSASVENASGTVVWTFTKDDFEETTTDDGYHYEQTVVEEDGTYTATLETAEDDAGNDGAAGQNDTAQIDTTTPTISNFTASNPSGSTIEVTFDSDESLTNVSVVVEDENDGTVVRNLSEAKFIASGSGPYTYTWSDTVANGSYLASLQEATDDHGNDGSDFQSDNVTVGTVDNEDPVVAFDHDPSPVYPGEPVNFTDTSSDADGSISSWSWEFGDGNGSTAQSPTRAYDATGSYTAELTVTDDDGASNYTSRTVTVVDDVFDRQWSVATGGRSQYASPAVGSRRVYAAGLDDTVVAVYRTNGTVAWRFNRSGSLADSSPAHESGTVYVGSGGGVVYAVNASTGATEWTYQTDSAVVSSPTVDNGTLYVGSNDGTVFALDADTGERRWRHQASDAVYSTPAVGGSLVYVTTDGGELLALDTADGTLDWSLDTGVALGHSSPTLVDGTVYVAADDVYAVDATTGTVDWTIAYGGTAGSSPAVAGDLVVVGSADGNVYGLNRSDGATVWTTATSDAVAADPVVVDGRVYVPSLDGSLYVIDATDGEVYEAQSLGAPSRSSPAVVGDALFVGARDGSLGAYANSTTELGAG